MLWINAQPYQCAQSLPNSRSVDQENRSCQIKERAEGRARPGPEDDESGFFQTPSQSEPRSFHSATNQNRHGGVHPRRLAALRNSWWLRFYRRPQSLYHIATKKAIYRCHRTMPCKTQLIRTRRVSTARSQPIPTHRNRRAASDLGGTGERTHE